MTEAVAGAKLTTGHKPAGATIGPVRGWLLHLTARAARERPGCRVSGS